MIHLQESEMLRKQRLNKDFFIAAGCRAVRTFLQALVAMLPTSAVYTEIDWKAVLLTALVAAGTSLCMSITAGLPEMETGQIFEGGEK